MKERKIRNEEELEYQRLVSIYQGLANGPEKANYFCAMEAINRFLSEDCDPLKISSKEALIEVELSQVIQRFLREIDKEKEADFKLAEEKCEKFDGQKFIEETVNTQEPIVISAEQKYVNDLAESLISDMKANVEWVKKAVDDPEMHMNLAITILYEEELTSDAKELAMKFGEEKVETVQDVLRIYHNKDYPFINSGGGMGNEGDISFEITTYKEALEELNESD